MKSALFLVLTSLTLIVSSCGLSYRDVAGKWEFRKLKYHDTPAEKQMDPFEFEQTQDLFKGMTYHFRDAEKFTLIIPHLNDEEVAGTYSFENDELVLKMKSDTKRYKVVSVKERELVLRELNSKELELKVDFVFTR